VRKSVQRQSGITIRPCTPRDCLCAQRWHGTRHGVTRRSPTAKRRQSLFEHCCFEGCCRFRVPKVRALFETTYFAGLGKARVPGVLRPADAFSLRRW